MRSFINIVAKLFTLLNPLDLPAFYMNVLINTLDYLKYLEIKYPPRPEYILDCEEDISFDVIPDMAQGLQGYFSEVSLPKKFEQHGLPSSFIVNSWGSLVTLTVVLVSVVLNRSNDIYIDIYWYKFGYNYRLYKYTQSVIMLLHHLFCKEELKKAALKYLLVHVNLDWCIMDL